MNTLRHLLVLLLLASGTTAHGQRPTLIVNVSTAAGGPVDTVARSLGREMGTILGKGDQFNNVVGEFGARAVREFRNAPADGSQILVLYAIVGQPAPEVSGLVPIATIVGESGNYRWVGVFAPPGTPASIANGLERAALAALNSPGYSAGIERMFSANPLMRKGMFTPTPGNAAHLARLIAQSAGVGSTAASTSTASAGSTAQADQSRAAAPRAPASASSPNTAQTISSAAGWPAGVEPGNLYTFFYRESKESADDMKPLLVSAKTKAEAIGLIESKWEEMRIRESQIYKRDLNPVLVLEFRDECTGPNWGATVTTVPRGARKRKAVVICGGRSPREAILGAINYCPHADGISCDDHGDGTIVTVGHSGAKPWGGTSSGLGAPAFHWSVTSFPHAPMTFVALGATTEQHFASSVYLFRPRDAIEQFGKACGMNVYGRDDKSCWITLRNIECIVRTRENQNTCVDTKMTADGYKP